MVFICVSFVCTDFYLRLLYLVDVVTIFRFQCSMRVHVLDVAIKQAKNDYTYTRTRQRSEWQTQNQMCGIQNCLWVFGVLGRGPKLPRVACK